MGRVRTLPFGGRETGLRLTDPYSNLSWETGVDTCEKYGHSERRALNGSRGIKTMSLPLSAGVMEDTTTVVRSVKGIIITTNVVCEFETRDSVDHSNLRGVDTLGVGEGAAATEGASLSRGLAYITTLDRTAVVMSTSRVVAMGLKTTSNGTTLLYSVVSTLTPKNVGRKTRTLDGNSETNVFERSKLTKITRMTLPLGPFIDV